MNNKTVTLTRIFLLIFFIAIVQVVHSKDCEPPFTNAYGPYDYTNPEHVRDKLRIVEAHHFNKSHKDAAFLLDTERYIPRDIVGDLDYMLRAFPNHHYALWAQAFYLLHLKNSPKTYEKYRQLTKKFQTIECYFKQAQMWRPKDAYVYLVFGNYYYKIKDYKNAKEKYQTAIGMNPKLAEAHYNMSLLLFKEKNLKESLGFAKKAYSLGYPLPFLKNVFTKKGLWD